MTDERRLERNFEENTNGLIRDTIMKIVPRRLRKDARKLSQDRQRPSTD
jgi:hypothetical protein